jgi:hypothetical protein
MNLLRYVEPVIGTRHGEVVKMIGSINEKGFTKTGKAYTSYPKVNILSEISGR